MKDIENFCDDIREELKVEGLPDGLSAAVEDCLSSIEALAKELEDEVEGFEDQEKELEGANDRIGELESELEESSLDVDPISGVHNIMSMSGEVGYATNNLIDEGIMAEFADCIAQVRPSVLLEYLANIKLKESVKTNI